MGIFQTVSNYLFGTYNVRTTKVTDDAHIQHVRVDFGTDVAEQAVNSANGLPVNIVAGGAGGTEYTEDAVAPADPVGGVTQLIRKDTPATITGADGDIVSQRGTNYGAAFCQIVTSSGSFVDSFGGSGGTAQVDESAFAEGTTSFTPVGGVLNDTIVSDPTEDQAAAFRITAKRAIHANLRNVGGTEIGTAAAPVRIDPTGTTTQPVDQIDTASLDYDTGGGTVNQAIFGIALPGAGGPVAGGTSANPVRIDPTGTTMQPTQDSASLVDNAGFTDGTSRILPAGFYFDESAGTALTENDIAAGRIDAKRAQVFVIEDETNRGTRATVVSPTADGASNRVALATIAQNLLFNGSTWDRQRGDASNGADVDVTRLPLDTFSAKAVSASSAGNNTIHTPAGGQQIRLYYLCISADGANSADVTAIVKFAAGGNTLYQVSLKAGAMWARNIGAGRKQLSGGTDNALIVNLSAAQTVYVSMEYEEVA
jgi:hypothetical protein